LILLHFIGGAGGNRTNGRPRQSMSLRKSWQKAVILKKIVM